MQVKRCLAARSLSFVVLLVLGSIGLSACAYDGPELAPSEVGDAEGSDAGVELSSTDDALEATPEFCWKGSYGRGAGTVPDQCPGQEKDAGLCYPYCKSGYDGVGPVCWQICPSGYTDDGAFCRRDAKIINADTSQCEWYDVCGVAADAGCSKCPSGYRNDGCTCRIDAHVFAKASYSRGAGAPMQCASTLEYDAGLCYNRCNPGYDGVGPVCWGYCPAEAPVPCAAGCAASQAECDEQVISQITATFECAANIGAMAMSLGTSTAVRFATKQTLSAAQKQAMREELRRELSQQLRDEVRDKAVEAVVSAAQGEPFDYASLDPTGIASLVEAFDAPSCQSLVKNLAKGKSATQSSTYSTATAARAVDGNTNGNYGNGSVTHTNYEATPWLKVDLGSTVPVNQVVLYNRTDCCSDRLSNFHVDVLDAAGNQVARRDFKASAQSKTYFDLGGVKGRYVRVQLYGTNNLSLAEVEVY